MKRKPAGCMMLGSVNLLLMALFGLMRLTHIGCCQLGGPANSLALVIIPSFLLLSIVFIARDGFRSNARSQAILAAVFSVPSIIMTFYAWTARF